MPRSNLYRAYYELADGRLFWLEYCCKVWPATRWEPEDVSMDDPAFFLDDEPIQDSQLPDEITDRIIDHLIDHADYVEPEYDGPHPDDYEY